MSVIPAKPLSPRKWGRESTTTTRRLVSAVADRVVPLAFTRTWYDLVLFTNFAQKPLEKGVRATLRAWVWLGYRSRNGPKCSASVVFQATLQPHPRLFGRLPTLDVPSRYIYRITPREPGMASEVGPRHYCPAWSVGFAGGVSRYTSLRS
jgi:hypothetical protein